MEFKTTCSTRFPLCLTLLLSSGLSRLWDLVAVVPRIFRLENWHYSHSEEGERSKLHYMAMEHSRFRERVWVRSQSKHKRFPHSVRMPKRTLTPRSNILRLSISKAADSSAVRPVMFFLTGEKQMLSRESSFALLRWLWPAIALPGDDRMDADAVVWII